MQSNKKEILDTATSKTLTYQQKLFNLASVADRIISPIKSLGYTKKEMKYINNDMICDLNEGYALYRPRYILPNYSLLVEKGCNFLEIKPPQTLDDLLDSLLIFYKHVPSITSFPVFIGHLDKLIDPFITNEKEDYLKIKRFLNHIDKTITDSFCHADIGPEETVAGKLILDAVIELENPTPNMTIKYNKEKTPREFAKHAAKACLLVSKPSFANDNYYIKDLGSHALCSCYNALPTSGGAYTLTRLRLATIAAKSKNLKNFISKLLPDVSKKMLSMMEKRCKFIVEKSNFFESSFLVKEGFIKKENFTAMFGIVGLADATNIFLNKEGLNETFGTSERGNQIAHQIMEVLDKEVNSFVSKYAARTNNHFLLHAQVGASLSPEDYKNTPAHRIKVGQEPELIKHITQSAPFHKYFPSGTGDLFAFDRSYLEHLDKIVDIIDAAFDSGYRYISTYIKDANLIRVTGYIVRKSEVKKAREENAVLRDTTWFGSGTDECANVFKRKKRDLNDEK